MEKITKFYYSNERNRVDFDVSNIFILCNNSHVNTILEFLTIIKPRWCTGNYNFSLYIGKI